MKIKRHLPPSPPTATKTVHNNRFTGYSKICEMPTPSPAVELQIPPQKSDSQRAQREKEMKLILDLARQGKTASEIEKETGYNKVRIQQMVNRYAEYGAKLKPEPKKKKPAAVKPPKPPKPPKPTTSIWTEENINKLIELHRQGLTYSEIARELGVTKNSVTSKVQRMINFGILESRMDHILWSEEDIEMLFKLREDGKTWAEIGKVFGKSSNTCQVTFSRLLERRTDNRCRKQSE
jgi:transposase